jgi:hypothetical protein
MFHEKADPNGPWSMTRVITFLFGVNYQAVLYVFAKKATPVNWPLVILGIAILLAVPLQGLVTTIRSYLDSSPGRALMETALHKVEAQVLGKSA